MGLFLYPPLARSVRKPRVGSAYSVCAHKTPRMPVHCSAAGKSPCERASADQEAYVNVTRACSAVSVTWYVVRGIWWFLSSRVNREIDILLVLLFVFGVRMKKKNFSPWKINKLELNRRVRINRVLIKGLFPRWLSTRLVTFSTSP